MSNLIVSTGDWFLLAIYDVAASGLVRCWMVAISDKRTLVLLTVILIFLRLSTVVTVGSRLRTKEELLVSIVPPGKEPVAALIACETVAGLIPFTASFSGLMRIWISSSSRPVVVTLSTVGKSLSLS